MLLVLALAPLPQAQGTAPPTPLSLITREGRRTIPTTMISAQEFIALDDLASLFQVSVGEDALIGGITVSYRVPPARSFAVDSFPDQHRKAVTDHFDFENLMPEPLMLRAVDCINTGRTC